MKHEEMNRETSRLLKKWTNEGILYRRENVVILKPNFGCYRVRRTNSKDGLPLEKGEGQWVFLLEALKGGNALVWRMRKEKMGEWVLNIFKRKVK